jgi:hypothetical protein
MEHDQRSKLNNFWFTLEEFKGIYGIIMMWDELFHVLKFLRFTDSKYEHVMLS